MLIDVLRTIFERDLSKMKQEIELFQSEKNIWRIDKSIANSSGNLCLHLVGNLNAYIGATLGQSGYIRNRDAEFSLKDIPQKELIKMVEDTVVVVDRVLSTLKMSDLEREYPVLSEKTSTEYFLVHLAVHLGYHLGQINYHRRLLDVVA